MTKTVLIVEDDESSANLYKELLQANGYETVHVEEGWEAMSIALNHLPDLIVMDIQLPDISGVKTSRMFKKSAQFSEVPIIAITAFTQEWTEEKCREAGCDAYMTKPFHVQDFIDAIKKLIDARP